jgi:hypothetical protein
MTDDLAPCPFTIVTSIGHMERATGYTWESLQLSFRVKREDSLAPLLLRCAVTDATNYDILVGQQTLYPLRFGLDNWTEEAWIRPGWSAGDDRKELIHVAFGAAATIEPLSMVFGCSAIVDTLPYGSVLLEELLAFMGDVEDPQEMAFRRVLVRYPKDPLPPWHDSSGLFQRCEDIVLSLGSTTPFIPDGPSTLARLILWRPPDTGITLVELFGGIGTGLVAILEAGLTVKRYVYVDNSQVSTRVARHHLHQLMVLYPQQLHSTAIHGCFSRLPHDVTLISEADLRHLGPVDMVIARWLYQGHSCAEAGGGLEDPRSSLFWNLIRLIQWWYPHQSSSPTYIFENVPVLGGSRHKVLEGDHYVRQHLGDLIFVDAASIGSYAHRPRWILDQPHTVIYFSCNIFCSASTFRSKGG